MSKEFCGFAVTLEENLKDEWMEKTLDAIRQIKGVAKVDPVDTENLAECIIESRIKHNVMINGMKVFISGKMTEADWAEKTIEGEK